MKFRSTSRKSRNGQRGYVMLAILLFATVMVIASMSAARLYVGQIKRDRELELVHRGAQYARAVKKYYAKFRRYPANLEQLENTNQIRFLRRRYKDPMTGGDFKLLHFGEVQLQPKSPNAATNPGVSAASLSQATGATGATTGLQNVSPVTTASGTPVNGSLGGAPIIGVESTSKKKSIMEFNGKDHYNQWEFIYDPSIDPGKGLIKGPYNGQTLLGNVGGQPGQPGIPTAPNQQRIGPGVPGSGMTPMPMPTPQPQTP